MNTKKITKAAIENLAADYKRLMTDTRRALDRLRRFHSAYVEATSAA